MISVNRIKIDELDAAMGRLRASATFDAGSLATLEHFICTAEDAQLYHMNPLVLADELGLTKAQATEMFLQGGKIGLFTLHWGLVCPQCGDVVQSVNALGKVGSHIDCRICNLTVEADLDDCVAVTFNVADTIIPNRFSNPELLSIEDYLSHHRFIHAGLTVDGNPYQKVFAQFLRAADFVEPNITKEYSVNLDAGWLRLFDYLAEDGLTLKINGEPSLICQSIEVELGSGSPRVNHLNLSPGPALLRIKTDSRRRPFTVNNFPTTWTLPARVKQPMLTGKMLLNNATFRELYGSDVIESAAGLRIKDLTFLFTDLKGSTELYEKVGDMRAFQLVHDHFQALSTSITSNQGTIVKTIGDAVMATFLTPIDAVNAAVDMLGAIADFNRTLGREEIILKIGIHTGAAIAVTQNDRLDYFGQTVNVAARVQALANADEICITEEVADSDSVGSVINTLGASTEQARIKGISDLVRVYRLKPLASRRAA